MGKEKRRLNEFKVYENVIKKHLVEIINNAFFFDENQEKYVEFKLIMLESETKKELSTYFPKSKTIRCYNYSNESCNNINAIIHEVSKHICIEKFGNINTKSFLYVYKKMLDSLFDLNKVPHSYMYKIDKSLSDYSYSETISIIKQYLRRRPRIKISNSIVLEVRNAYKQKEFLKKSGFMWDGFRKCWRLEIEDSENASTINQILYENGITEDNITLLNSNNFLFTRKF